jgi:hypothetical protein
VRLSGGSTGPTHAGQPWAQPHRATRSMARCKISARRS